MAYPQINSGYGAFLLLVFGLSSHFFMVGCNRASDSPIPGEEKIATEPSKESNFSTKGEFFLVDIANSTETIPRSDPRFKAILRLLEIGEDSKHFPATDLGGYSLAPMFSITTFTSKESSSPIDGLTHYLEHMIWTERHGLRKLPGKAHNEMLKLWDSMQTESRNGGVETGRS